jgi:hypothetical protein
MPGEWGKMACYYTVHLTDGNFRETEASPERVRACTHAHRVRLELRSGLSMGELTRKPRRASPGRSPAGQRSWLTQDVTVR